MSGVMLLSKLCHVTLTLLTLVVSLPIEADDISDHLKIVAEFAQAHGLHHVIILTANPRRLTPHVTGIIKDRSLMVAVIDSSDVKVCQLLMPNCQSKLGALNVVFGASSSSGTILSPRCLEICPHPNYWLFEDPIPRANVSQAGMNLESNVFSYLQQRGEEDEKMFDFWEHYFIKVG